MRVASSSARARLSHITSPSGVTMVGTVRLRDGSVLGVLDADHTGLDEVKDRIVEELAVRKLRAERVDEAAQAAELVLGQLAHGGVRGVERVGPALDVVAVGADAGERVSGKWVITKINGHMAYAYV